MYQNVNTIVYIWSPNLAIVCIIAKIGGWTVLIILINDGLLSIGPSGTNFNKISTNIQWFSYKEMNLKMYWSRLPEIISTHTSHDNDYPLVWCWVWYWPGFSEIIYTLYGLKWLLVTALVPNHYLYKSLFVVNWITIHKLKTTRQIWGIW